MVDIYFLNSSILSGNLVLSHRKRLDMKKRGLLSYFNWSKPPWFLTEEEEEEDVVVSPNDRCHLNAQERYGLRPHTECVSGVYQQRPLNAVSKIKIGE